LTELTHLYDRVGEAGEPALRSGRYAGEQPPVTGDPRWGLSAVIVPPPDLADRLAAIAAELTRLQRGPHLSYQAEDIHFTVRSLEGFQEQVERSVVEQYAAQLRTALGGLRLQVRLRGLVASPGGVFACGYPNPAIAVLRHRLHEAARDRAPAIPSVDAKRIRNTFHASLTVLRPPACAEAALADRVAALRTCDLGEFAPRQVDLVSYEWSAGSVVMRPLAVVPVGV
jgi:2'-5' RNA ligase